jgi:hypothetical protein
MIEFFISLFDNRRKLGVFKNLVKTFGFAGFVGAAGLATGPPLLLVGELRGPDSLDKSTAEPSQAGLQFWYITNNAKVVTRLMIIFLVIVIPSFFIGNFIVSEKLKARSTVCLFRLKKIQ